MAYSFNRSSEGIVFASAKDMNASFKDLGAVCDAIRYKSAGHAVEVLDQVISGRVPILYRKHNKYMGSRHELGGRKGRTPIKCAKLAKKVLINAMANAEGRGEDPQSMYVIHASANKTTILSRTAPKGVLRLGHSMGRGSIRRTDLELARIEIGLGYGEEAGLSDRMKKAVKRESRYVQEHKPVQKQPSKQRTVEVPAVKSPAKDKQLPDVQHSKGEIKAKLQA